MINRDLYILIENSSDKCDGCMLLNECDLTAYDLGIDDYMLCAEDEDFERFENPIYVLKNEKENSIR